MFSSLQFSLMSKQMLMPPKRISPIIRRTEKKKKQNKWKKIDLNAADCNSLKLVFFQLPTKFQVIYSKCIKLSVYKIEIGRNDDASLAILAISMYSLNTKKIKKK